VQTAEELRVSKKEKVKVKEKEKEKRKKIRQAYWDIQLKWYVQVVESYRWYWGIPTPMLGSQVSEIFEDVKVLLPEVQGEPPVKVTINPLLSVSVSFKSRVGGR